MIQNLKEILAIAEKGKCAVGSFNITSLYALKAVLSAAEELNTPVIIQFAEGHNSFISLEDIGPLMVKYAERSQIPVCVHLDHGETLPFLKKALDIGFTSIMFDGSNLPYEKNTEMVLKSVELAKSYNAGVEAEIGSMGKRIASEKETVTEDDKIYTDPVLAAEFVEKTGIDALACSFGTNHGVYLKHPKLNYDIVKEVRERTHNIPVVMHGGSGLAADDYVAAINAGVRKVNYFTYLEKAAGKSLKKHLSECDEESPLFIEQAELIQAAMNEDAKRVMRVFACK